MLIFELCRGHQKDILAKCGIVRSKVLDTCALGKLNTLRLFRLVVVVVLTGRWNCRQMKRISGSATFRPDKLSLQNEFLAMSCCTGVYLNVTRVTPSLPAPLCIRCAFRTATRAYKRKSCVLSYARSRLPFIDHPNYLFSYINCTSLSPLAVQSFSFANDPGIARTFLST